MCKTSQEEAEQDKKDRQKKIMKKITNRNPEILYC